MSQDEIAAMDGGKCIVRPFFSDKFDIRKHGRYRELSDYDKKNAFDIEKYVSNPNRMKVTQNTEIDEAFDCGEVSGCIIPYWFLYNGSDGIKDSRNGHRRRRGSMGRD